MLVPFPFVIALHEGEHVIVSFREEEYMIVELDNGADVKVGGEIEERVLGGIVYLVLSRLLDSAAQQKPTRRPTCNRNEML